MVRMGIQPKKGTLKLDLNKDAWRHWYPQKEDTVEEDMPKLAEMLKESGLLRILDLGCGTGRHTIYFAESGFEVYGFDFSEHAIRRAKERLEKKKLRAYLQVGDMTKKFPYTDGFFDAVISTKVIHHATTKNIRRAVAEINRTLKQKGYFYTQVPSIERMPKYGTNPEKTKWIEPGTLVPTEGEEKGIPHHVFTRQEITNLLNNHSFEIKEIHETDGHIHVLAVKK